MSGAVLRRGTGLQMSTRSSRAGAPARWTCATRPPRPCATGTNPELQVSSSIFFNNGPMGTGHFIDSSDNDGMFNEDAFLRDAAR